MIGAKLLAVKPLLWICGALLAACLGMALVVQASRAEVSVAEAERDTANALLAARTTERDAALARVGELATANVAWSRAADTLQAELDRAQGDIKALDAASREAVARARAEARDADTTLKRFVAQFATESRRPACAQALTQMEAACPALSQY